jgi:alkaline phosphatase D
LDLIEKNNIKGVVFLTGDRHCTELSALTLPNGNKVYDLTCSPLTSGAYDNTKENNTLRVEGTIVPEQNYGIIEITGPQKERKLTINIYTSTGTLAWTRTLDF